MTIEAAKGFFLSRVKSNAAIWITEVIHGLSSAVVGSKLSVLTFKRKRKAIIELLGEIVLKGQAKVYRVIGFWNPAEKNRDYMDVMLLGGTGRNTPGISPICRSRRICCIRCIGFAGKSS